MSQASVRICEYYDVFNVKVQDDIPSSTKVIENYPDGLPNSILPTNETNNFSGFNNFPAYTNADVQITKDASSSIQDYSVPNSSQYIEITGKHKAPQALSSINIADNGDIYCYPPNVSVPYWDEIVFRHYDYNVKPSQSTRYYNFVKNYYALHERIVYPLYVTAALDYYNPIPEKFWNKTSAQISGLPNLPENEPYRSDGADFQYCRGIIEHDEDYSKIPIYVKFDQYQTRSKVVFSPCDKTNTLPDVHFKFGYQHGQMEPIKLNLSLSCNNPITFDDTVNNTVEKYNGNLIKTDIEGLLNKCYWCIEWIYNPSHGN